MLPTDEATIAPKAAVSSSMAQGASAPNVVEGQISFGGEVIRKMIHFGSLSIPIGYYYVTKGTALQVLVPVMIFSLVVDLARPDATARIAEELRQAGLEPQYMVNNAGYGLLGAAAKLDRGEQLAMIDLNVRTTTDLSLRFMDSLARRKGGILNVASVASFLPGPGMAVYHATKAYVLSFSEALHHEMKGKASCRKWRTSCSNRS